MNDESIKVLLSDELAAIIEDEREVLSVISIHAMLVAFENLQLSPLLDNDDKAVTKRPVDEVYE